LVGLQTQVSSERCAVCVFVASGDNVVSALPTDHHGTTQLLVDAQFREVDDAVSTSAMRDVSKHFSDGPLSAAASIH
jgi:hypothetical protein